MSHDSTGGLLHCAYSPSGELAHIVLLFTIWRPFIHNRDTPAALQ